MENSAEISTEEIAALIVRAINIHNKPISFYGFDWNVYLASEPKLAFSNKETCDILHFIYKISNSNEINRDVVRIVCNALKIAIDDDWLNSQTGEYLICKFPNSKVSQSDPHYIKKIMVTQKEDGSL